MDVNVAEVLGVVQHALRTVLLHKYNVRVRITEPLRSSKTEA
jgi:hypothetical protein